ncbi:DotA/TraY family protein [Chromobacterium haemolyticum]|uniref:DotA/TraY family protein n=1 Tax=Chromobacterium haemolyticum TaxID=394935 RepID=UPI0024497213|nr:DotA/TraY family protein [Chromobacterium haemolyticum]MDH0342170.1 DotA/TraY family protein [Chromobacterium haemolyticum]
MKKLLTLLLLGLVTSMAYAASPTGTPLNQFTPPAGDTSIDFLREVFGNIVGLISTGGNVEGGQNDDVLGAMMTIFNSAVLFLGMVFVGYTTIKGTVDSAHDGEVLGRKMSSIWVPLRTVGGTAFLLPLGSGYSLIQIGILWLAIQGVGVADAIWKAAIEQINRDNMIARPMIPDSRPLASNILKYEVCAAAMNKQFEASGRATRIQPVASAQTMMNTGELLNYDVFDYAVPGVGLYTSAKNYSNAKYTVKNYQWKANDNSYLNPVVCGGISWKQSWEASEGNSNTKVIKAPILAAHAQALQNMIQELQPVASQIVNGQKPSAGAIDTAANNYENALRNAAKNAVSQTNDRARSDFLKAAKDGGWIFAGTWYNHIVKMNDVMQSTLNGLPTSEPIDITDVETKEVLQTYQDAMATADEYAKNRVEGIRQVYHSETDIRMPQQGEGAWEYVKKLISAPFMGAINQMTQEIAGSNLNHMSQMKSFGDTLVGAGGALLATLAMATGAANSVAAKVTAGLGFDAGAVLQFISGISTFMVLALFAFGVTLSTYVPMIPFITWLTSVVNWFVLVLESVIAGPLFAVAHVHPDGDDAVGKAGHGYMMILSLIMRPALMLFGLIGAMLLTQPVTGMVNVGFMTVVAGVQADSMTGIVSFLAYVAIYVILMTTVVHIVFSLIHWIPDNILRWIGAHAGGIADAERSGDQGHDIMVGGVREVKHGATGGLGGKHRGGRSESGGDGDHDEKERPSPSDKDLLGGGY